MWSGTIWDRVNSLGTFSARQVLVRVTDEIDMGGKIDAKRFMEILEEEWLQDLEPREQPEMTEEERTILFGADIPEMERLKKEIWDRSGLQCPGCEIDIPPPNKEPKIRKCPSCKNMFIPTSDGHCECGAKLEKEEEKIIPGGEL